MGDFNLESIVRISDAVYRKTNHFRFFNFLTSLMTETPFREDHDHILVLEPLSHLIYCSASSVPQSIT